MFVHGAAAIVCSAFALIGCDLPGATFAPVKFSRYLESPAPQTVGLFGAQLKLDQTSLLITEPAVIQRPPNDDAIPPNELATAPRCTSYLFDLAHASKPIQLTAPNVDLYDCQLRTTDLGVMGGPEKDVESVALSDDWAILSAAGEDSALTADGGDPSMAEANNDAEDAGAVYVYDRKQLAKDAHAAPDYLKAQQPKTKDFFGYSIALSGSWLAIGAPGDDSANADPAQADMGSTDSGAVYLYRLEAGHFAFKQYLKAPQPMPANFFGVSVALDGELLVVGAGGNASASTEINGTQDDTSLQGDGAAYVYRYNNGEGKFDYDDAYLKPAHAEYGQAFGGAVRISNGRIAAAAPWASRCPNEAATNNTKNRGAVYTFVSTDDQPWSPERCFSPSTHGRPDLFGAGLGLAGDRLLVGAGGDWSGIVGEPSDDSQQTSGAAYLEELTGSNWREGAYLKAETIAANDAYGLEGVDLDSTLIAIGALTRSSGPHGESRPTQSGAVYVYTLVDAP